MERYDLLTNQAFDFDPENWEDEEYYQFSNKRKFVKVLALIRVLLA